MNASNKYLGLGLATLSGCLWFLAVTPFDWSALAWIASVPMLLAIDRAPTWRNALLLGWWAGVIETAGGFYWIVDLTQRFAGFPWIAGVLVLFAFCAARALIFLLFTALVYAIRRNRPVPMAVLAMLAMPVCEFIVPQIFPCGQWISQAWNPRLIQISELSGPLGVTALLMLVNGALYDLIDRTGAPSFVRGAKSAGIAGLVVAVVVLFGTVRMRQVDALVAKAPRLAIGLVQPNFAYSADGEVTSEETQRQLSALQEQSTRLQRAGAQLIVWSEGSYPLALPREFVVDFPEDSDSRIRRGFDVPLLLGANTLGANDEAYNSAMLLDADGRKAGIYDKVWLLAFGEYIPGIDVFPWLKNLLPAGAGAFRAGAGPAVLNLQQPGRPSWRLGPVICYEDLLPDFIKRVGRVHPDILVNLTSDSWFGARTEPWEHLALAVFSAVELRVALVRSVNSGISALVDPNGRVLGRTYADDPYRDPRPSDGIVVSAPKMAGGHTLFVAWGNWFAYSCAIILSVIGVRIWRTRRAGRAAAG